MFKYKTITKAQDKFDEELNKAIQDNWNICGSITSTTRDVEIYLSILLSKYIKDETN